MKTVVWFGFVLFGELCAVAGKATVTVTKPGMTVPLSCGDNTYKNSLEWKHGNDLIYHAQSKGFPRKGKSDTAKRSRVSKAQLTISDVNEIDAGRFTCKADGRAHDHTLLVVSMSASSSDGFQLDSEVTLQCRVRGLNSDPAVRWLRPDGSSLTGSEKVQLKMSDSGSWNCTFTYDGVRYSRDLYIKVQEPKPTPTPRPSHDQKDSSKPKCVNCGSGGSSKGKTDAGLLLGLSWWMWVIIGVGCLVVVLLTVSVICLCKRVRRRRRKLHKMKNSRQQPKQFCQCNRQTAAAKPQQRRRREKPSALPLQPLLLE